MIKSSKCDSKLKITKYQVLKNKNFHKIVHIRKQKLFFILLCLAFFLLCLTLCNFYYIWTKLFNEAQKWCLYTNANPLVLILFCSIMSLWYAVTLIYSSWNITQSKYINIMDIIMRDIEQQHSITLHGAVGVCRTI